MRTQLLNVVVSGGVVHVWGVVATPEEQAPVRAAAESALGVKGVRANVDALPTYMCPFIIARYIYTARDYACELINMRSGDIFMGAFNAEQVMYNHFGYRSPIANLYNAGSAGHPGGAISGGAGYIAAGIIERDLGLKLWWKPWEARVALEAMQLAA